MSQWAPGASSPLLRGAGVIGDSECVAAGVSIPLLRASGAVTRVRGFAAAGAPGAPCREVPAPWRMLLSREGAGAGRVPGCSGTCRLMMPSTAESITRAGQWPGLKFRLGTHWELIDKQRCTGCTLVFWVKRANDC